MEKNNNTIAKNKLAQIEWSCRRGMLELDVLLGNFFRERYIELDPLTQKQFTDLLSMSDPEIHTWLLAQENAPEEFLNIVNMIRDHARSRL